MYKNGCDNDYMKYFRHEMHKHPETAYQEHNTQQKIKACLLKMGVSEHNIKVSATTGLIVDLQGKQKQQGKSIRIAIRADIDALPMQEHNNTLPYHSTNQNAHACGHDGHTAILLSTAYILVKQLARLGKQCQVRLLFQPAEEGPGGAHQMIKEGCLQGVDEVYGLHNMPDFPEGQIRTIPGPFFAQPSVVKIKVKGRGGHGSVPHKLVDSIACAAQILNAFHIIKSRFISSKEDIVFTITQVQGGRTYNVLEDDCFMQGTIRSYAEQPKNLMKQKIEDIVKHYCQAMNCSYNLEIIDYYPATINHLVPTTHVIQVAQQTLPIGYFSQEDLPLSAGEDFSYYLQNVPGCFLVLGTQKEGQQKYTLHANNYDFNDDMIYYGAHFWIRLLEHRFATSIFQ